MAELPHHIGQCYREAGACREAARRTKFAESRVAFEALEQSWLQLARQHEFLERLNNVKAEARATEIGAPADWTPPPTAVDRRRGLRVITGGRS